MFSYFCQYFWMFVPHIYLLYYSQISMYKFGFWLVSNGDFVQTKDEFLCRKHSKSSYKFDDNLREKIAKNTEILLTFHGFERKIVSYSVAWDCH